MITGVKVRGKLTHLPQQLFEIMRSSKWLPRTQEKTENEVHEQSLFLQLNSKSVLNQSEEELIKSSKYITDRIPGVSFSKSGNLFNFTLRSLSSNAYVSDVYAATSIWTTIMSCQVNDY